ncbi:MAG: hypothetical protein ABSH34_04165 [Verrucomicrobiota bacterium]
MVPLQFAWAPAESTPALVNVASNQVVDLGFLAEGDPHFVPRLCVLLNDFQGFVGQNECVRFSLEIAADGCNSRHYQVFEVAWNGCWSDNLDQMAQNLTIREVVPDEGLTKR